MKQFMKSAALLIAALSIGFGMQSCSTTTKPIEQTKLEGHWVLTELNGKDVKEYKGAKPTLEFDFAEKLIAGSAGCNRYFGGFELNEKNEFTASKVGATLMACLDMEIEDIFLKAMQTESLVLNLDENGLLSFSKDNKAVLVFKIGEKIENKLLDVTAANMVGEWKLVTIAEGDVTELFGDRVPTMTVTEDGKLSGFAGCNRFNSNFELKEDVMTTTMPMTTRMACDHLEGEGLFTSKLTGDLKVLLTTQSITLSNTETGITMLAFEKVIAE